MRNPSTGSALSNATQRDSTKRATRLELVTFSLEGCGARVVTPQTTSTYELDDPRLAPSLADFLQNDPGLRAVVEAWPELPGAIRAGIVAMVRAAASAECTEAHGSAQPE